jgi:hypothetical protein
MAPHSTLLQTFQGDVYTLSSVHEWIRAFKTGRTSVLDDHRAERSHFNHTDSQILSPFHENEFQSVQTLAEERGFVWAHCMIYWLTPLGSHCDMRGWNPICWPRNSRSRGSHFNRNVADSLEARTDELCKNYRREWVLVLSRIFPKSHMETWDSKYSRTGLTNYWHREAHAHHILIHDEANGWWMVARTWHISYHILLCGYYPALNKCCLSWSGETVQIMSLYPYGSPIPRSTVQFDDSSQVKHTAEALYERINKQWVRWTRRRSARVLLSIRTFGILQFFQWLFLMFEEKGGSLHFRGKSHITRKSTIRFILSIMFQEQRGHIIQKSPETDEC